MKILIHDYSGHPFQVELSRELARRGYHVVHAFSCTFQTPQGNLEKSQEDPETFEVLGVMHRGVFEKDSFFKRRKQEIQYGKDLALHIRSWKPDIVISSNAPLDAQLFIQRAAIEIDAQFIFWLQDIYSEAIEWVLKKKIPWFGWVVGRIYRQIEAGLLRRSDRVVAIAEQFKPKLLGRFGVSLDAIEIIENWAPLNEITPQKRDNSWADEHMITDKVRIVYSGTLGYKHYPRLLIEIAANTAAEVYVFSEGKAADFVREEAKTKGLQNLHVRPWVPYKDLPSMLSGADILLAMIEKEAGIFCVPSKVLTYMCVGRPVIASLPRNNLAGQILINREAGLVSEPGDMETTISNAQLLIADSALRAKLGENGRKYAVDTFDISKVANRFEKMFN